MNFRATDPHAAVDHILKFAAEHATAKAQRVFLEGFKSTKKALLMSQCDAKTSVEREQFAYAHPEYQQVLEGLREAVQREETLKWEMTAAQSRIEIWRSEQANNRNQDRVMR